jgi:type II secretory pathway component PulM
MKKYWDDLALREKTILGIGSVIIILILVYSFAFIPIENNIQNNFAEFQQNKQTLFTLKRLSQELNAYPSDINQKLSMASLANVQAALTQAGIPAAEFILTQKDTSIELRVKQASFDKLMTALVVLHQQYHLEVSQAQLKQVAAGSVSGSYALSGVPT